MPKVGLKEQFQPKGQCGHSKQPPTLSDAVGATAPREDSGKALERERPERENQPGLVHYVSPH